MSVVEFGGRLIEISVVSDHETDGWIAEVWDLTPETGGQIMAVQKPPSGPILVDLYGDKMEIGLAEWLLGVVRAELSDY